MIRNNGNDGDNISGRQECYQFGNLSFDSHSNGTVVNSKSMVSSQQLFLHHIVLQVGAREKAPSEIFNEPLVSSYNHGGYLLKLVKLIHCGTYTKT